MPAGSNRSRRVGETSSESKPEEEETEVDKALRKRQGKRSSSSESQGSFESFEANPHPEGETATRSNPDPEDPEKEEECAVVLIPNESTKKEEESKEGKKLNWFREKRPTKKHCKACLTGAARTPAQERRRKELS